MSRNKFLKLLFSALLIMTMAFTATTSAYAATGTKKVTSSGTTFRVSGLPANAVITKLEVNPGSLKSYSGAVLTNYLTVSSSNRSSPYGSLSSDKKDKEYIRCELEMNNP